MRTLLLVLLSISSAFGQIINSETLVQKNKTWVVAHRGGHLHVPENSLGSIDEAVEAGAAIIELDVRETQDGIMVLMHDKLLDRTTTAKGELKNYTYAQLQKMFLLHHGSPTHYQIPTFKEALAYAKNRAVVDIDFKVDGMEARYRALDMIKELGMEQQVLFFLYDYTEMAALYAHNPKVTYMPRAYSIEDVEAIIKLNMTKIIHIDPKITETDRLKKWAKDGYKFWMNTLGEVDKQKNYAEYLKKYDYVSIWQTDFPEILNKNKGSK